MNNNLLKQLYQYDTPKISDALDAYGVHGFLSSIKPLKKHQKLIGPAFTVKYQKIIQKSKSFMQASNYIDEVPSGAVIVIDNDGDVSCSVWGGILTHFAYRKNIAGTVVHGAVRDQHDFVHYNYPIYAIGSTARTGKNRVKIQAHSCKLYIDDVQINFNDIIFADDNGVLVIPKESIADIITMVKNIEQNEAKILEAIDSGCSLKEARERYNYDCPWVLES
jgi:regulator of RNase E activity RraA